VYPCFTHNSLPTLLDAASPSVTWRYYANESWAIWNAPNAIYNICMPLDGSQTICTGSDYINNDILNPSQVLHDLGAVNHQECNLKQVSWVIPNGDRSDHPGLITGKQNSSTEVEGGPSWVADIINTLGNDPGQCGYWNNTAVFIVWDDWGGFYDHVAPFKVVNDGKSWGSGYVYGFRVPFLVVSAYTGTLNQNGTLQRLCFRNARPRWGDLSLRPRFRKHSGIHREQLPWFRCDRDDQRSEPVPTCGQLRKRFPEISTARSAG
jgi:phospholipase C